MKNITNFIFILLLAAFTVSCASKESYTDDAESAEVDEWKEFDEFHMVMAESFHPYKDSANLAPAKELAAEMAQMADQWSQAQLPTKVDNDETKQMLQSLKDATTSFAELTKSGDDAAIGSALTNLHDLFHSIQEVWYKGGSEHEGHEEHH